MHNPHISVPNIEDKAYSSMVHLAIQNLRLSLRGALTEEVAEDLGILIHRVWTAGYNKGADDAAYDSNF